MSHEEQQQKDMEIMTKCANLMASSNSLTRMSMAHSLLLTELSATPLPDEEVLDLTERLILVHHEMMRARGHSPRLSLEALIAAAKRRVMNTQLRELTKVMMKEHENDTPTADDNWPSELEAE